ncbi:hypothetical protein SPFL3102_00234 [Sporomusaceae bacterium FL31]|nr:hypothetical protein SPFL3101_01726 [Sporomusaceae bacterium FL31]GCE32456.1 hypothetical protein SPFL3102_00234 [Sporomusaceae bacterium]
MVRPKLNKYGKNTGCAPSCLPNNNNNINNDAECPDHPDLCLLRDAAADERGAIADYLDCALSTCVKDVFLHVAEDEMRHYVQIMRMISSLDPIQAEMLEDADLDFLTLARPIGRPKWTNAKAAAQEDDVQVVLPNKKDICAIRCLTKAIQDELHAINKYQRYMNQAQESEVRDLFCELMNEEKEHVAEFTSALFKLTNEPLPED